MHGRDVYNSKYITAEITDRSNRLFFVPIKYTLGDYFVADIEKQLYVFKIDGSRIKTHRNTLTKSFRVLQYDTNHFLPTSPKDTKEFEKIQRENSLPKTDHAMFSIFKLLGSREKKVFKPHNLKDFIQEIKQLENQEPEKVKNVINYLENLDIDKIVTPVRNIAEFIQEDLITPDAGFFGTIINHYERTDLEHKKVTNTPITGKSNWLKIILIVIVIIAIGFGIYMLISSGTLSHGIPGLNFGGGPSSEQLMKLYPTPESMRAAIDSGKLNYDTLPPDIKALVDKIPSPIATNP